MTSIIDQVRPLSPQTQQLLEPIIHNDNDTLTLSVDPDYKNFQMLVDSHIYYSSVYKWKHRLPEHKFISNGALQAPATDTTALVIAALWPREMLRFEDEAAKAHFDYLILTFTSQLKRAEIQARFKATGEVALQDPVLAPYQRCAVQCSLGSEYYALFMEQGTGKTLCVIRRVDLEAAKQTKTFRTLVVCPKAVRLNWEHEVNSFSNTDAAVFVIRGGKLDRIKLLVEALSCTKKAVYVVASYESMRSTLDAFKCVVWDLAVLDESHYIKSKVAKRTKASFDLRAKSRARMALTGTPIVNHAGDLFTQFEFLNKGGSGFTDYDNFFKFYNRIRDMGHIKVMEGLQNVPLLQERLARMAFVITKKDALKDLPDKLYDIYEVEMSPEQLEIYRKTAAQIALEVENELEGSDNQMMTVNNALTKMLRLAQITSGFVTYDRLLDAEGEFLPAAIDRIDPNPKIEALVEILSNKAPHEKTIVWACWVQDIKSIQARLKLEGIDAVTYYGATKDDDREAAVDRFNNDTNCKVFLGNPACAGVGLNLLGNSSDEDACDHVIYFSQNWSAGVRAQSEDRAHRRGTKRAVQITDLCIPGTIDTEIRERVVDKRIVAYRIQNIRELLSKILECVK